VPSADSPIRGLGFSNLRSALADKFAFSYRAGRAAEIKIPGIAKSLLAFHI
jgi:hypothetical protein